MPQSCLLYLLQAALAALFSCLCCCCRGAAPDLHQRWWERWMDELSVQATLFHGRGGVGWAEAVGAFLRFNNRVMLGGVGGVVAAGYGYDDGRW